MEIGDPAYAGQRDSAPFLLRLDNPSALGPIARFVWRCPTPRLIEDYRLLIAEPHLDIGPGTGYFINHSGLRDGDAVMIVHPNPNVLRRATARLRRFDVTAVQADVLEPMPVRGPFASAGLHFVLHRLPGPSQRKAKAVEHVAAVLEPNGVLFGATVLGEQGRHSWLARRALRSFNRRGIFDNLADSEESLRSILEASFEVVDLVTVGSIAIFTASRRRGTKRAPRRRAASRTRR